MKLFLGFSHFVMHLFELDQFLSQTIDFFLILKSHFFDFVVGFNAHIADVELLIFFFDLKSLQLVLILVHLEFKQSFFFFSLFSFKDVRCL